MSILAAILVLTSTLAVPFTIASATSTEWTATISSAGLFRYHAQDIEHNNNYVIEKADIIYLGTYYSMLGITDVWQFPNPPYSTITNTATSGETYYEATYYHDAPGCDVDTWNDPESYSCFKSYVRHDFLDSVGGINAKYKPTLREAGTLFNPSDGYPEYEAHWRIDVDLPSSSDGDYAKLKNLDTCMTTWVEMTIEQISVSSCNGQAWRTLDKTIANPVTPSIGYQWVGETYFLPLKYHTGELESNSVIITEAYGEYTFENDEPIGRNNNIDLVVWHEVREQAYSGHCMPFSPCSIFGAWITNGL